MNHAETPKRFNPQRIYSALVFIPFFYFLTRYLHPIFFFFLIMAVSFLAMLEFYGFHFKKDHHWQLSPIGLFCAGVVLVSLQWPDRLEFQTALLFTLAVFIIYQVGWAPFTSDSFSYIPILWFGMAYISLTLGHFLMIRKFSEGPFLIFFILMVTWGGDAAAYYAGKHFGTRPLAPILSPKKTIEGLIGGIIIAPLIAWGASVWFLPLLTLTDCLVLGIGLTLLGLIGDLSESAFKRQAGAKDSGSLIPGHGGFLDRIDSLLLTVPTFYYYLVVFKGSQAIS